MIDLPELLILDVGHGNCAILRDTKAVTVIDCGYDGLTLIQTLDRLGINTVDHVLISHADIDHIGGLVPLVKEYSVGNIYMNADSSKKGKTWKDVLLTLDIAERSGTQIHIGLTSRYSQKIVSGEVDIEILSPSPSLAASGSGGADLEGLPLDSNAMSVVIGLQHKSHRVVLLPGDMDEVGLSNLLKKHNNIEAQVLLFPHHGGNPGNTEDQKFATILCDLVKPDLIVFSLHRSRYENPNEGVIQGVIAALPNVHIMCTQLSAKCSSIRLSSDFSHLTNFPAKGNASNTCCGGTIHIKIDGDQTTYDPLPLPHRQFVQRLSHPLCLRYLTNRKPL